MLSKFKSIFCKRNAILFLVMFFTLLYKCTLFGEFIWMPIITAERLDQELQAQILEDAKSGEFDVAFTNIDSLTVSILNKRNGGNYLVCSGRINSDAGTFPYTVVLRKLLLSNQYRYDDRYLLSNENYGRIDLQYPFAIEELHMDGETVSVEHHVFWIYPLMLLFLAYGGVLRMKEIRCKNKSKHKDE